MDAVRVAEWRGSTVEEWRARWGVPALHVFASVGSTNDVARALAEDGAPEATTVLADAQTRGRGRRGRVWHADPGRSLILSMVVRPRTPGAESVLSIRLGLAVARAIESLTPLAVRIKWPNDLLIDSRKVGGMLCEGVVEGERPAFVVAGTGVNVLQHDDDWTGPLAGFATSLAARTDRAPDMDRLAGAVIGEWLPALDRAGNRLSADELAAFHQRHALQDRAVTVDGEPGGVVQGVDPDGALRLEHEGRTRRVVAGTVRPMDTEAGERS